MISLTDPKCEYCSIVTVTSRKTTAVERKDELVGGKGWEVVSEVATAFLRNQQRHIRLIRVTVLDPN